MPAVSASAKSARCYMWDYLGEKNPSRSADATSVRAGLQWLKARRIEGISSSPAHVDMDGKRGVTRVGFNT